MGRLFWVVSVPIAIGLAFILLFKDIRTHINENWKNRGNDRGKDRPGQPSTTPRVQPNEKIRQQFSAVVNFLRRRKINEVTDICREQV